MPAKYAFGFQLLSFHIHIHIFASSSILNQLLPFYLPNFPRKLHAAAASADVRSPCFPLSTFYFLFFDGSERVVYTLKHHKLHACFLPLLLCVRELKLNPAQRLFWAILWRPGPHAHVLLQPAPAGHAPHAGQSAADMHFEELSIMQPDGAPLSNPSNYLLCIFQCFSLPGKYGNCQHFEGNFIHEVQSLFSLFVRFQVF